jgi:DNA mismatch endonuclease, patch repair protein
MRLSDNGRGASRQQSPGSWATSFTSRRAMQANRSVNTGPEIALRRAVHALGLRYRVNYPISVGDRRVRPDLVFTARRICVFSDGCFWHRCPEHGSQPKANSDYWTAKLRRNVERDRAVDALLAAAGWTVIRVWEHEDPQEAARTVLAAVRSTSAR